MRQPVLGIIALLMAGSIVAEQVAVRTVDGRWYVGTAVLSDHNTVTITPAGAEPVIVPLGELKLAVFHPTAVDTATTKPSHTGEIPCTLILKDGSSLAGTLRSIERAEVGFTGNGQSQAMKRDRIARIHFTSVMPEGTDISGTGHCGAILESGDLLEGELTSFENGRATFSSVLFGNKTLTAGKDLLAIVCGEVNPSLAHFVVTTASGSALRAKSLHIDHLRASVEDGTGGKWEIPAEQISEIAAEKTE